MRTILSTILAIGFFFNLPAMAKTDRVSYAITASEIARTTEIEQVQLELTEASLYVLELKTILSKQRKVDHYDAKKYISYAQFAVAALASAVAVKSSMTQLHSATTIISGFTGMTFLNLGFSELGKLSSTKSARLIKQIDLTNKKIEDLIEKLETLKTN